MQCPNCGLKQPEGAETCAGCGLIFAKWRERHPEAATAPSSTPGQDAIPTESAAPQSTSEATSEQPPSTGSTNSSGSAEATPDKPQAGSTGSAQAETNPFKRPLPEREYAKFNFKKFGVIAGIIIVGVGVFTFWPSSEPSGYVAKPVPRPTSLYGSATEEPSPEPTWTPFPCGYPEDTCTPTPIPTPKTIVGEPWHYHGKVLDELRTNPIVGAQIVFSNNGVAVTAISAAQGVYEISVPPLSGDEAYLVQLSHPDYREGYWTEDPTSLTQDTRLARSYDYPENQHLRGTDGGGGDKAVDFSMYPVRLSEQENMWIRNVRPNQ